MNNQFNTDPFFTTLKERVAMKEQKGFSSSMVLHNAFAYYDFTGKGISNLSLFKKVLKNRFAFNMYSDKEIEDRFKYICQVISNDQNGFNVKEFIDALFNIQKFSKVTNQGQKQGRMERTQRTQRTRSQIEENNEVQGSMDKLIKQGRQKELGIFIRLYYNGLKNDVQSPNFLQQTLKETELNLSQNHVDIIQDYFNTKSGFDLKNFLNILTFNFRTNRRNKTRQFFDRLDLLHEKKMDLNLLLSIFIPQNFFKTKLGYFTISQTQQQFQEALQLFLIAEGNQPVDQRTFLNFLSFISVYIDSESDFESFIDTCFRFNEVKLNQTRNYQQSKSRSPLPLKSQNGAKKSLYQEYQQKQGSSLKEILQKLYQNLLEKGNRGFLNFYFKVKAKENYNDNSIFYEDLTHILDSSKCYLTTDETKLLFKEYSNNSPKMKTQFFIEHLIPFFNKLQSQKVDIAFQSLQEKGLISFLKIQNFFNSKVHPDTVNHDKTEYESKAEFLEFFHKFATFYQGNGNKINKETFVRFFEMYCQGWDDESFSFFVENCFSKKNDQNYNHHQNIVNRAPYAIDDYQDKLSYSQRVQQIDRSLKSTSQPMRGQRSVLPSQRLEPSDRNTMSYESRSRHGINSVKRLNDQIQRTVQNSQQIYNEQKSIQQEEQGVDVMKRFRQVLKKIKNFACLLEYEYELTMKSDDKGFIPREGFLEASYELFGQYMKKNDFSKLYDFSLEQGKLHSQMYINYIRDQLTESQELLVIDLFEKLVGNREVLDIKTLRNSFQAKNFSFAEISVKGTQEMWEYMLDLFQSLNLSFKNPNVMDIEDFMYFFDNFGFFIENDKVFRQMLSMSFR